ncbi:MAG TPA: aspartyl protease family protein [Phnomibacter sp.]|nr:aspartyl protease family protein [Phnomibacter sp.]
MKNPSQKPRNLLIHGPLLEAEVYQNEFSFLAVKNNLANSPFAKVKLMVDTGSNISGLDRSIIQRLQLSQYTDRALVDGVGGMHSTGRYKCILFLPIFGSKGLPLDVLEGHFTQGNYHGVIGRDVLQYCRFVYNGPQNQFELTAIDF